MSTVVPAAVNAPLPVETPVVRAPDLDTLRALIKDPNAARDLQAYLMTAPWADYLGNLAGAITSTPQRVASANPIAQTAAIPLTTLPTSGSASTYIFGYLADITVPASVSSSLTVTVTFTQNGTAKSFSSPAITGNTQATVDSDFWMIYADANTPVQYSTAYASVGTTMSYGLIITLSSVNLGGS